MATIPNSAQQDRFKHYDKLTRAQPYGNQSQKYGTVLKVFDREYFEENDPPLELSYLLQKKPGKLYAQIKLDSKAIYFLPFRDSVDLIYSVYGDALMIEGRRISVVYFDNNIYNGEIVILSDESNAIRETKDSSNVFDIGGIFGG